MRVMFYVQHLLGIGHLVRASRIASALADAGHKVHVVSGGAAVEGFPPQGVQFTQLEPVRSVDLSFSALVDEAGNPIDEAFRQRREAQLQIAFDGFAPDCLLLEAFPFARRQMRFELMPLLEHVAGMPAADRPLVAASVRDILQPKGEERDAKTAQVVERYFDLVLVHADEGFARFEDTFTSTQAIAGKLAYTGMVAPATKADPHSEAAPDVVVSAGGGAVGVNLLQAALEAREKCSFAQGRWLVVTGPNLADAELARLQVMSGDGVTLSRFEPDLARHVARAKMSVSQAGYNTVADVLVSNAACVLVPFEGTGEREQLMRASRLQEAGRAVMVREGDLNPVSLARAIDAAAALPATPGAIDMNGAVNSAAILAERLEVFRRGR